MRRAGLRALVGSWLALLACTPGEREGTGPGASAAAARPVRVASDPAGPAPPAPAASAPAPAASAPARAPSAPARAPQKVDVQLPAMGTRVHFVGYATDAADEARIRDAFQAAHAEILRIEALMTSWNDRSDVGRINAAGGLAVEVAAETVAVLEKARWASELSGGAFDVTFHVLSDLWKFGDAADPTPRVPTRAEVSARLRSVDYRRLVLHPAERRVTLPRGMRLDLGGIAKGYAVDAAARVLRARGLGSFLAQAGGDLYGAGHKPDGSPWVSGVQDPRGPEGSWFALLELEDRAFSTAGDYARAYLVGGKRYHHILDPRTGYPADACRSVTVWAPDALLADAIDDAVFILGPERGLAIIESLPDVGAVVVDRDNRVHVSRRLEGKIRILRSPTDGP